MMRVRQLYDNPILPYHYIVEMEDGAFKMFAICGFRNITEKDLHSVFYKPQAAHTRFVTDFLYRMYGLEKIEVSDGRKEKKMTVREAVEKMGGLTEGKHAYRIGFVNVREEDDETELDVDCVEELEDLWASLVSEFECEVDSITYIEPAFYDDPEEVRNGSY